jgi:hypothetical protein
VTPCWWVKSYRRFGEAWSANAEWANIGTSKVEVCTQKLQWRYLCLSRVAQLRIHSLHTRRIQLMGMFVSNVCWPVCWIAPMSLPPLLNCFTNLAEIHNYAKVVTTGTTSPLLSSNIKNTIFFLVLYFKGRTSCETACSNSTVDADSSLLGHDTVSSGT